jgi:hypothetical protein
MVPVAAYRCFKVAPFTLADGEKKKRGMGWEKCGAAGLLMQCPYGHHPLGEEAQFCDNCGMANLLGRRAVVPAKAIGEIQQK